MFDGKVLGNYTGRAIEELAATNELNSIAPIQVTNIRLIRFGVLFAVNISISRFRICIDGFNRQFMSHLKSISNSRILSSNHLREKENVSLTC